MNKDSQTLVGVHHIHLIVPESALAEARRFSLHVLGWPDAALQFVNEPESMLEPARHQKIS